jgi:hypothetical protein
MVRLRSALLVTAATLAALSLSGCAAQHTSKQDHASAHHSSSAQQSASQPTFTFSYAATAVTAACAADIAKAADAARSDTGQDPAPEDVPLDASATDCSTVNEWVTAVSANPDAIGNNPVGGLNGGQISEDQAIANDLAGLCSTTSKTYSSPLCTDARANGLG